LDFRLATPFLSRCCGTLAVQPHRQLLLVPLGIQRQQPRQHVIAHGIGPAVAPGEFASAADGAGGLQLTLEIEGVPGIPEEQVSCVDALLQGFGELNVVFEVEVIEAEAAGGLVGVLGDRLGERIAPAVGLQHRLIQLLVQRPELQLAAAGFGGIVEAVVGAGEAFVVAHHQLGAELVVALADGFEALAGGVVGGFAGGGIEESGGEGEGFEAVGGGIAEVILHR